MHHSRSQHGSMLTGKDVLRALRANGGRLLVHDDGMQPAAMAALLRLLADSGYALVAKPRPDPVEVLRAYAALGATGVAAAVRQARKQVGLTVDDAAALTGVSASTVWGWETGVMVPHLDHLVGLFAALDEHSEASEPPLRL